MTTVCCPNSCVCQWRDRKGQHGAGAFAHTLLILLATQRLTPRFGAVGATIAAVTRCVLHNIFYASFSHVNGFLADRFPKNRLLAARVCVGNANGPVHMFLPIGLGIVSSQAGFGAGVSPCADGEPISSSGFVSGINEAKKTSPPTAIAAKVKNPVL
jgi:hypothetical protein